MGAINVTLMDAAGNWRDTWIGLARNPLRSAIVIIALGALDEATVRLIVAVTESLPPETFSYPQYALAYQALTVVVTLLLCAASVAGAYFVVSNDRRISRSADSETPPPKFGRWMRRAVLGWCLIIIGSGIISLAIQFVVMFLGIEGTDDLDGIDWVSGLFYALLQALLAAFLLLRVPDAAGRPATWPRRSSLFASYIILFLGATLLMYVFWLGDGSLSTAWNLRAYYFITSLVTVLSVLLSCSASRRFADRDDDSAIVFD